MTYLGLLLVIFLRNSDATTLSSQNRLSRDLLANYNSRYLRPVLDPNSTVHVYFRAKPFWLADFEETTQLLKFLSRNQMKWKDELLTWNPDEYDGITEMVFSKRQIWFPDITLYERVGVGPVDTNINEPLIVVNFLGEAIYYEIMQLTVFCKMNVRLFPLDNHRCTQKYTSYTHHGKHLYLHATSDTSAKEDVLVRNGVWSLNSYNVREIIEYYACCTVPYVEVHYTLDIHREPWFYVINIGIPTVLLSFVTLSVFLLHPGTGEKIAISVSNVLALIIFQQLLSSNMPPTGDQTPITAYYFAAVISVAFLSVLTTSFTLSLYHNNGDKPLPGILRILMRIPPSSNSTRRIIPTEQERETARSSAVGENIYAYDNNAMAVSIIHESSRCRPTTPVDQNVETSQTDKIKARNDLASNTSYDYDWKRAAMFVDKTLFWCSFVVMSCTMLYCVYCYITELNASTTE